MPHFSLRKLKQRRHRGPRDIGNTPLAPGTAPPDEGSQGLALPHERDESLGHTAQAPDPRIAQAKRDIDAGLVDTDLRGTPGMDAERRKALLERKG